MDFELSQLIERLTNLLENSPNRSDFKELLDLRDDLEKTLAEHLHKNKCGKKKCPVIKEKK